jgi:hypothetical protein
MIDLIVANQGGTPLGASGTGDVPQNSLGALLQRRGKQRPLATYLAAIACCEELIGYENLGRGPNRGVLLYPAEGEFANSCGRRDIPLREDILSALTDGFSRNDPDTRLQVAAATELRNLATRVEACEISEIREFSFQLTDIDEDRTNTFSEELTDWSKQSPGSHFIYSIVADSMETAQQCEEAFADAKAEHTGTRKFARFNGSEGYRTLYVGRSANIAARMTQHFGFSYPGIYSLQMAGWCQGVPGSISIEVIRLEAQADDDVVQAMEDYLWLVQRPAFGRRGAR